MRQRRVLLMVFITLILSIFLVLELPNDNNEYKKPDLDLVKNTDEGLALNILDVIDVKGKAPKTNYERNQFGSGWQVSGGCNTRELILQRDLQDLVVGDGCKTLSGTLNDPYTGKIINFKRGVDTSADVQIDHVVALGNAWQTGAQQLTLLERTALANDPLELLAVDGPINQQKSDSDSASWLPPNKPFRCQYVARQIAVKKKYNLWVTAPEKQAMQSILSKCPGQTLPNKN